jgi:hypothetical protein
MIVAQKGRADLKMAIYLESHSTNDGLEQSISGGVNKVAKCSAGKEISSVACR